MTYLPKFSFSRSHLPNGLSFLRAALALTLPFMLIAESRWIHLFSSVLFIIASITDYLDGWIARRQGLESNFGKILDPTSDKILILLPLATFAWLGYFSKWWLVPIFFREILITFIRIAWYYEGKAAGAEKLGKIKLVFQVALVGFAFLEFLTHDYKVLNPWQGLAHVVTLLFLIGVNALTIISGFTFLNSNKKLFGSREFSKFVSACGVGLLPGMTGTWGSLLALFFIPLLYWSQSLYWGTFVFLFWVGLSSVSRLDLSIEKDPKFVVIDEVLGMWVTFAGLQLSPTILFEGFCLFRILDVIKPFPCRQLEKLKGFWGITLDDLGAGFYACAVLHLIQLL